MGVSSSYFVIDSLPAGTYSAEVMDANGCNVIVDFTVSAADSVIIYASEYLMLAVMTRVEFSCSLQVLGLSLINGVQGIRRHMYGVLRLDWYRLP